MPRSSDFFAQIFTFGMQIVSGLFVGAYVARYLGAANLGVLALFTAVLAITAPLVEMGTPGILVRHFALKKGNPAGIYWSLLQIKFVWALVLLGVLYLLISGQVLPILGEIEHSMLLIGLGPLLLVSLSQNCSLLTSAVQNKALLPGKLLILLILAVLKVLFVLMEKDLIFFVGVFALERVIHSTNAFYAVMGKKLIPWPYACDWAGAFAIIRRSMPLLFASLAAVLYTNIDAIMISLMMSEEDVGLYSVGVKIMGLLCFIPMALNNSMTAGFYTELEKSASEEQERAAIEKHFNLFGRVGMLLTLVMLPTGYVAVRLLYGEEYSLSSTVFAISVLALPAVCLGLARSSYLIHKQMEKSAAWFTFSGLVINVLLNWFLIPMIGIVGCSVATCCSYYVSALLTSLALTDKGIFINQISSICPINFARSLYK